MGGSFLRNWRDSGERGTKVQKKVDLLGKNTTGEEGIEKDCCYRRVKRELTERGTRTIRGE